MSKPWGRWGESGLTGDMKTLSWMSARVVSFCHRRWGAFQNLPSAPTTVLSACLSPWRGESICAGDRWLKCQRCWQPDSTERANLNLSPLNRISDRRHAHVSARVLVARCVVFRPPDGRRTEAGCVRVAQHFEMGGRASHCGKLRKLPNSSLPWGTELHPLALLKSLQPQGHISICHCEPFGLCAVHSTRVDFQQRITGSWLFGNCERLGCGRGSLWGYRRAWAQCPTLEPSPRKSHYNSQAYACFQGLRQNVLCFPALYFFLSSWQADYPVAWIFDIVLFLFSKSSGNKLHRNETN